VIVRCVRTVHAEILANCPFSVSAEYASEYLKEAEGGGNGAVLHAGPLGHRVTVCFGLRTDVTESGRSHDEILLRWSAGSAWLPDFVGTLRIRIENASTRLVLDGSYAPPGGPLGRLFDAIAGRRIARATAEDVLRRVARALEERELLWRKGIEGVAGRKDA
jgi:hypothetical protein